MAYYAFNDDKSKHDIDDTISDLMSRVAELEGQVGGFSGDILALQGIMSDLENDMSDLNDDITSLDNNVSAMSVIGTHYQAAKSTAITVADMNTYAEGPSITLPAGSYVITGLWQFNTAASGVTDRNMETRLRVGSALYQEGQRVRVPNGNFARLNCVWAGRLSSETTVTLLGSASVTSSALNCYINAVRVK